MSVPSAALTMHRREAETRLQLSRYAGILLAQHLRDEYIYKLELQLYSTALDPDYSINLSSFLM